jgi:hypothetical protein
MGRREEAHRLLKPSTAAQPEPTVKFGLGPRPRPVHPERRCTNWHAVPGVSNRCASRTQRILRVDRGWGLGGGSAAFASRVIRGLLAAHVIGALGGEDGIVGCADARRRIGCLGQAPSCKSDPSRNRAPAPGATVHELARRTGCEETDALRGLSASYVSIVDGGSEGKARHSLRG